MLYLIIYFLSILGGLQLIKRLGVDGISKGDAIVVLIFVAFMPVLNTLATLILIFTKPVKKVTDFLLKFVGWHD